MSLQRQPGCARPIARSDLEHIPVVVAVVSDHIQNIDSLDTRPGEVPERAVRQAQYATFAAYCFGNQK